MKVNFPELYQVEKFFDIPFSDISDIEEDIKFRGKIDAVFTNGSKYMVLDWKTDRNMEQNSKHRQQLESYKNAFCEINKIEREAVEVGIAFIGLRPSVNTGFVDCELDTKKPGKNVFNTFLKRVNKIIEWKNEPDIFLRELSEEKVNINTRLWQSVVDQYFLEINRK